MSRISCQPSALIIGLALLLTACGQDAADTAESGAEDVAAPATETEAQDAAADSGEAGAEEAVAEEETAKTDAPADTKAKEADAAKAEKPAAAAPAVTEVAAVVPAKPPAAFAMCKACHTVDRGAPALMGPNLAGVFGSRAGSKPGFSYSPAMQNSGVSWNRANLDALIANPQAFMPGTRMILPPVGDAAKRKAIVDYLETL